MGSLIFIFIFFLAIVQRNNPKVLLSILFFSLLNDLLVISVGIELKLYEALTIIFVPKFILLFKQKVPGEINKFLFLEFFYLILIGVFFSFIAPWETEQDATRTWAQQAQGRTLISLGRLVVNILFLYFSYFLICTLKGKKIEVLGDILQNVLLLTSLIGIVDFALGNLIKYTLFSHTNIVIDRLTAFNNEPRAFGRSISLVLMFLLFFSQDQINSFKKKIAVYIGFLGIFLSFSASTYLFTSAWLLVYSFTGTVVIKKVAIALPIMLVFYFLNFSEFPFFQETTLKKIEKVVGEKPSANLNKPNYKLPNEPEFFTRFEVFDRAALNFLYNNSEYFITGTGPNLISIPASNYIDPVSQAIYGNVINSVPHTFLINLISRSGLIGVVFFIALIFTYYIKLKGVKRQYSLFFIAVIVSNLFVSTDFYFFYLGLLTFIIHQQYYLNQKGFYDFHYYPSAKWEKIY